MISTGGEWRLSERDEFYKGELHFSEDSGTISLTIYYFSENIQNRFTKSELSVISGKLTDGATVTLLNCSIISVNHNLNTHRVTYKIRAKYAFFGILTDNLDDLRFSKISFQLKNAIQWAKLSNLKHEKIESERYGYVWKIREDVVLDCGKFILRVYPSVMGYNGRDLEEIKFCQTVVCDLESTSKFKIDLFIAEIAKLVNLVTFCINDISSISELKHYISFNGEEHEADLIIAQPITVKEPETLAYDRDMLSLDLLTNNENLFLKNWYQMYDNLDPIINLLNLSINYPEMPTQLHYVNTVNALESFHKTFVCMKIKEYKERVEKILFGTPEPNFTIYSEFLLKDIKPNSKQVNLYHRLADLYLAEFEINFSLHVKSTDISELIKKLVDTRNYYTHYVYNSKAVIFTLEEMRVLIPTLRIILTYHLLKKLGLDQGVVKDFVKEKLHFIELKFELSKY